MALDILIGIVALAAVIMGFMRGLIGQAGQIAGVVAALVASRLFAPDLAGWWGGAKPSAADSVAAHIAVFVAVYLLIWLVVRAIRGVVHAAHLGIIDRLAGAAFKLGLWMLMLSVALNAYCLLTGDTAIVETPGKPWRATVARLAPAVLGYVSDTLHNITPAAGVNQSNDSK